MPIERLFFLCKHLIRKWMIAAHCLSFSVSEVRALVHRSMDEYSKASLANYTKICHRRMRDELLAIKKMFAQERAGSQSVKKPIITSLNNLGMEVPIF
jgi:hypothetical protein